MSGMVTTGNTGPSGYENRTILVEVTQLRGGNVRNSQSTYKVPYSSFSQLIQRLNRTGAKVTRVSAYTDTPDEPQQQG